MWSACVLGFQGGKLLAEAAQESQECITSPELQYMLRWKTLAWQTAGTHPHAPAPGALLGSPQLTLRLRGLALVVFILRQEPQRLGLGRDRIRQPVHTMCRQKSGASWTACSIVHTPNHRAQMIGLRTNLISTHAELEGDLLILGSLRCQLLFRHLSGP